MRLGYYTPQFPFQQGASAGPYPMYPNARRPRVPCVIMAPPKKTGCGCGCGCKKSACRGSRRHRGLRGLGDSTAGLPAGSQLVYTATWHETANIGPSSSSVEANLAGQLGSYGIVVDSYTTVGVLSFGNGFTLKIHTSVDYGAAADVQSIIDHIVYELIGSSTGGMPQSTITTTSLAAPIPNATTSATATNPGAAATDLANYNAAVAAGDTGSAAMWYAQYQVDAGLNPPSPISWLETNAGLVAAGMVGLALLWRIA
jgi:hypothetical protein